MSTYKVNEYTHKITTTETELTINVSNDIDEFELKLTNDSDIFQNHSIIKNISMLNQVLNDCFNNSFNVTITFNTSDPKYYVIKLEITTPYITDNMTLQLARIEHELTLQDAYKTLTTRCKQLEGLIETKVKKTKKEGMHKLKTIIESHTKTIGTLEQVITVQFEQIHHQSMALETLRSSIAKYILTQPLMIAININAKPFNGYRRASDEINIYSDISKIQINYSIYDGRYYLARDYRIQYFDTSLFAHMTNLETVIFKDCPFNDVNFLHVNGKLKNIMFANMPALKSIGHLASFPNLVHVQFVGNCVAQDLLELDKCIKLRCISVPKGTQLSNTNKPICKIVVS